MAERELKFVYKVFHTHLDKMDYLTFTDVDHARQYVVCDSNWNHSLGTQHWSLDDTRQKLILLWTFTEEQANDQLTVHEAILEGRWHFVLKPLRDDRPEGKYYEIHCQTHEQYYKAQGRVHWAVNQSQHMTS